MEKLNLTKTIYGVTKANDSLDEEFKEFVPKTYNIDDLFDMYNSLFYDMIKEGKKHSHFNIVQKSTKYAGSPINPKDEEIESLNQQIELVDDEIWSIEDEHEFFPNGSILRLDDSTADYYMQSGRRRKLNSREAFKLIKRRAGKKDVPDDEYVIWPISNSCIASIIAGPPVNNVQDLNIDIMSLNRFDERQFEEEYQ